MSESAATSPTTPALRVVMFVYNDVSRDSRVLREAKSLADAGHRVTVIGRPKSPDERQITRHTRDGFEIALVPMPHEWRTLVVPVQEAVADARAHPAPVPASPRSRSGRLDPGHRLSWASPSSSGSPR